MDRQLTFEILLYLNIFFTSFFIFIEALFLFIKYFYVHNFGKLSHLIQLGPPLITPFLQTA